MLHGWTLIAVALGYIGLLFLIASYGDRQTTRGRAGGFLIYPLSLAIYCTSWTFFGSVGLASRSGFDFLAIYIGPVIVIGLCSPLIARIARVAKEQNITSVADFIAARYGKSRAVATTVALVTILGTIPYIALQLKAVSSSLQTVLTHGHAATAEGFPVPEDIELFVALLMAVFGMLFGTRHVDATEHQHGLMLAIATESVVKLVAFLTVGVFVTFYMFDGPAALFAQAEQSARASVVISASPPLETTIAMMLLSIAAIILLPRQFHVAIVENNNRREIRRAAWMFPLYLLLINLFVIPIAAAGLLTFAPGEVDSDMFVLALPMTAGSAWITVITFIGGLSAATAMVIVECVALSIMISNDIVVPWVLHQREALLTHREDIGKLLLRIRRIAILVILFLAFLYHRFAGDEQLAAIGLLSFAALAQLAPAFFGGLVWRRATGRGAIAGIVAGFVLWLYTLLLPTLADAGIIGSGLITHGPFGLAFLNPQALFGLSLPRLAHSVLWSLSLNIICYITASLRRAPSGIEQVQASIFVPTEFTPRSTAFRRWRSAVTVEELITTVARYLGDARTRMAFADFAAARRMQIDPDAEADVNLVRHAEHLLASAIGTASSRLVLALLLRKRNLSAGVALKLLDEANAAIHHNREILQTALEHVRQGIAVFDRDLQLVVWNSQFGEVLNLPLQYIRVGTRLDAIVEYLAEHDSTRREPVEDAVRRRMDCYLTAGEPFLERFPERGQVIEVRVNHMPDEGVVTTFTDMTPSVRAAETLERANETLERRVRQRTEELTTLNEALGFAKREADDANISKTRFLAAASHDVLQPLNAARLYVTSLLERENDRENARLAGNIDASLEAVEEILGALLEISRLDTGTVPPDSTDFHLDDLLSRIEVEFAPLAKEKGLTLVFVPCHLAVHGDRRLLRRLLQNLVSNAIKYTRKGRVLVGCRRREGHVRVDVYDTGIGIAPELQGDIFKEFHRLDAGAKIATGLGLGLSIVQRIAQVLDLEVRLQSSVGHGSHFSVELPLARSPATVKRRKRAAGPDKQWLSGTRALCIDNEPTILDGMQAVLTGWGCAVMKAVDLDTAFAAVEETRQTPDILLVDYHLGGGSGIDAVTALRQKFGADLPAILITADRSPAVRLAARVAGIDVLGKPVRPAALRALLAQVHRRRIAAAE